MTSIIKLHAISGCMGESPPCYILQIDDFRFLLDCGWDEKFDMDFIGELKKYVHKIDAVLLSHSDTYHLGALPYLVGKCGLRCPVYATIPVFKMGQMFMYDWYLSRQNTEQFELFNLDDVDAAFDKILQLEYNSPVNLKGRGHGISITALPAGHSLGGSIWKISKAGDDDIYYAIDHNNKKERHLNGCEIEKIQRPGILITNAFNALYVQEKRRKRDEMLMGMMQQTLRSGGNALIAADSAGRALELILMMDQMWRMKDSGLAPYSLVFLNNVAFNVLEFAKSQVEWMSEKLIKAFETQRTNPFQLRNVVLCHTLIELSQIPSPKVVITSTSDLECGFSRDLFLQWCQDPRSCIILTNRSSPGTLARNLIDEPCRGKKLELEVKQKVRLEGKELEDYYQQKRNDKKRKIDVIELEDSSDDEVEIIYSGSTKKSKHDLFIRAGDGTISVDESSVFKLNNNNHPSFPSQDSPNKKNRRFDDYGEVIRLEDFKENGKQTNKDKAAKRPHLSSVSEASDSDPPTRTLATKQLFSVNAQVMFIDFEGRSDVESLLKMVQEMQPHKLVLVRGQIQSTMALEVLAQKWLPNVKIYKPSLSQVLDLTSGSQILQIRLTDALASSLQLKKVRDCEVAWVDGNLVNGDGQISKQDLQIDPLQAGPSLELLSSKDETPKHQPLVVNRLRLTELKQILAQNDIESEFKNGILQCTSPSGVVYIQKDSATRSIHIESEGLPEKYYLIRSLVYSQLAML